MLVFSNEDLNDIIKIIKSLEDAGFLIKGVTENANVVALGVVGREDAVISAREEYNF